MDVRRVVLSWDAAYARSYRVQILADGSTWTTLYALSTDLPPIFQRCYCPSLSLKYLPL